jgi:chromatin segregation and condensation protein Rec8/ScpA/Scc1 (kleisin family)
MTRQYLTYVDEIRSRNLELAAEYLLMAAMLIEIKSRMLLPPKKQEDGEEAEDPRAELVRRLLEYEQMKLAAQQLGQLPTYGRDFQGQVYIEQSLQPRFPDVEIGELQGLARHPQARQAGAKPQDHARRAVGARVHEPDPQAVQGRVSWSSSASSIRKRLDRAGRDLYRHARAGQGNADRNHPGRSLRTDLCAPGLPRCEACDQLQASAL